MSGFVGRSLLKHANKRLTAVQSAYITSKAMKLEKEQRPPPFPYKTKHFGYFQCFTDNTVKRFNENTKLIVVEGNIGAGKSAVAKKLAEELDMKHYPEANLDMFFVNDYGFDMRQLDHKLPEGARSFDVKDFYKNPNHWNVAKFQLRMYQMRFLQYVEALCHMMNTGQGVVLERCVYSDLAFMETMRKFNYLNKGVKSYYYQLRDATLPELLQPHLVIYLDVPVNVIMDRIKKRNIGYEVGSKVLTKEYLSTLEEEYRKYLSGISKHAELLVYDWSAFGDIEVVVEDVERIDFDSYDKYDEKMRDWRMLDYWDYVNKRLVYTSRMQYLLGLFNVPRFDVPEIIMTSEEADAFHEVWDAAPGNQYTIGYNKSMGDKGILFKMSQVPRTD